MSYMTSFLTKRQNQSINKPDITRGMVVSRVTWSVS